MLNKLYVTVKYDIDERRLKYTIILIKDAFYMITLY